MSESYVCRTSMENLNTENIKQDCRLKQNNVPESIPIRPSAIPRLLSPNYQRCEHPFNKNGGNEILKSPLSPLNNQLQRPRSFGSNYIKSPVRESENISSVVTSPLFSKRSGNYLSADSRTRYITKSLNRYDRAVSEESQNRKTSMESSLSEKTSNSGNSTGNQHVIVSKINSLANSRHKPGGGNIKIYDEKLDFKNAKAKCGSKKNIKHKPGGGVVEIHNEKVDFSKKAQSKVNSFKNLEYKPGGGEVKIDNLKLDWNVTSKVGSLANIKHKPSGGNVIIATEPLPWLKYNKPNLPPEEMAKINKKSLRNEPKDGLTTVSRSCSNSVCSDRSN